MFKNPTPRQIAIFISIIIALSINVLLMILKLMGILEISIEMGMLIALFSFIIAFFISNLLIKRFIYRRIKLIYKNIHRFKLSKKDKFTATDVTDTILDDVEKEVEEWVTGQEQEIQNLKSLEAYRRNFLGNISHELKTPIFSIQGYIHTLLDGGLHDDNINVNYLQRAAKNTERLQVIIEDLDAISKLESGELILEIQSFDIKQLVYDVFEELEMMAQEQQVHLQFKEGAERNFIVRADKEAIRQVLVNLISNSIKYGKKGGRTKISFYDMDTNILVEVADNGIGMPEEHLPHVFDRFYRVDKSRSRAQGGSGLGLSIVKHIIEAHQQTINVRSTPELGSTFGFTLAKG